MPRAHCTTWASYVASPILLKMIRSFLCQPNIRALSKSPNTSSSIQVQPLQNRKHEKTEKFFPSVTKHSHSDFASVTAMNGEGTGVDEAAAVMERFRVFMMGYLPGALPQRSPLLSPTPVRSPPSIHTWRDVCGGGCGFAMAISGAFSDL